MATPDLLAPPSQDELAAAEMDLMAPPSADELSQATAQAKASEASPLKVGAQAALGSATFGLSDEAIVRANAMQKAREQAQAEGLVPSDMNRMVPNANPEFDQRVSELEGQFLAQERERLRLEREASPTAATVGEIAGLISPVGPAAGAFKIGARGAKALGKSLGIGGKIAQGAAAGAGGTAAFEGVREAVQPTDTGLMPTGDIGESTAIGAALGAAPGVLGVVGRGVKGLGKAAFKSTFGVTDEAIEKVIANPEKFAKIDDVASAKEALADEAIELVKQVKENAVAARLDVVDETQLALERLKEQSIAKSDEALDILEASGKSFDKSILQKAAKDAKNKLFIAGKAPVGESAKQAVRKIDNFSRTVESLPDELAATDMKQILKQLDKDVSFLSIPGSFEENLGQRALKAIRSNIDKNLKSSIPLYESKMKEVAGLTAFTKEASKAFGGQDKISSALTRIGKPGREIKDEQLLKFAKEANVDLDRFRRAQEAADLFKSFNDQNVESKLMQLTKTNSRPVMKAFEFLGELSDTNFIKGVEDLQVASQLESTFLRGSRNVNLWAVIGGAATSKQSGAGGALGFFLGGPTGALAGAAFGSMIDLYGPRIAKNMLIQVGRMKGIPTVAKIKNLDLPKKAKEDLVNSFVRTVASGQGGDEPVYVPPADRPQLKQDISLSPSLSDIEKAEALSRLNKYGETMYLKKMVTGGETPPPSPAFQNIETKKPRNKAEPMKSASDFIKQKRELEF